MKTSTRAERVADEVRAAISAALLTEVEDPRLRYVNVTAVKLSPDLQVGRVYWNLLQTEVSERDRKRVKRALEAATGFLRRRVAENVVLRYVPTLQFFFDESIERGRRMEGILSGLEIPAEPAEGEGGEAAPAPVPVGQADEPEEVS